MAPFSNKSPFAGHSLEGLEHKFGNVFIAGEINEPITVYEPIRPFEKLPGRVICNVPLELQKMNLFVKKNVAAGDLLYKIERPLINIVKDGQKSLESTCDNCFATFNELAPGLKLFSIPDPQLTFLACNGCKVYYYCNRTCQKAAWKHHHKYECETLRILLDSRVKDQDGNSATMYHEPRAMIRLLCLHKFNDDKNNLISKEEWSEFLAVPTNQKNKAKSADSTLMIERYAKLWEDIIEPELHHDTIVGIICSLSQYSERIQIPLLKGAGRSFDSLTDSTMTHAGIVVEPVSALLEHSCEPNTWTVFEGKEMRVRALKDIPAGTQLTRSYQKGFRGSYEERQWFMKSQYGIDCKCEICQLGHRGPTGALLDRVDRYTNPYNIIPYWESAVERRNVDRAITAMQSAGFGYDAPQMRALHKHAMKGNIAKFDTATALKNCLKIYYLIEPACVPSLMPSERINTLFNLSSLLDSHIEVSSDHMKACAPLPADVQKLRKTIIFHLKAKIHQETEKWFGADSTAGRTERLIFEDIIVKLNQMLIPSGQSIGYVPLNNSAAERAIFVKAMNELLKWAGIPAQDAKNLV